MKIQIDTHTHSTASGHAYSTIEELVRAARKRRLKGFVLTDHGWAMKGAPFLYHFGNLKVIPRVMSGVRFYKGIEANIMDFDGTIDIPEDYYRHFEFILAGFHEICLSPGSIEQNTRAAILAMENPYVDAISHPGNPAFPIDIGAFVDAAARYRKPIEINNSSFTVRKGSADRCEEIVSLCRDRGVRIVCGTDAHISFAIGCFDRVIPLLKKIGMPAHLIVNSTPASFEAYLLERGERIHSAGNQAVASR